MGEESLERFSSEYWMSKALELAQQAALRNEVPVGAVIVFGNEIIGSGSNNPISGSDPTAHAEIIALREAAHKIKNYRLVNADIYVTLEPCAMCAGALVHGRIRHLYYGAKEAKSGAVCSHIKLLDQPSMNHQVKVTGGVCEAQCSRQLSDFFARRRAEKKAAKLAARKLKC